MKTNNIVIKIINILLSLVTFILMNRLSYLTTNLGLYIIVPIVTAILICIYNRIASFSKLYIKIIFDILLILSYGIFIILIMAGWGLTPFDYLPPSYGGIVDLSMLFILIYISFKVLLVSIIRIREDINKPKLLLTTASLFMLLIVLIMFNIALTTLDLYFMTLVIDNNIFLIMFTIIVLISTYDFKTKKTKKM